VAVAIEVIERAARDIVAAGLSTADALVGCTALEVQDVEIRVGGPLPAIYRAFLERMGRSVGDFMRGSDFLYPTLLTLRDQAEALLRGDSKWRLHETAFVFMSHQGYQFLFFDRLAGDDPPVQYYLDGDAGPREVFSSFSKWLTQCVADEVGG
jgi:SMI1/KNR4 family protein SUKH-1